MALFDDIKTVLRISSSTLAFDNEINDLIKAAKADMILIGILPEKVNDETDPLIKRAISIYCKANFGWNNPDSDKYQKSYSLLRTHLSLSAEYTEAVI